MLEKYNKDQKLVIKTIVIIFIIVIIWLLKPFSKDENIEKETFKLLNEKNTTIKATKKIDYSSFEYVLPSDDFNSFKLKIKISSIETHLVKNAFEEKENRYSTPIKKDGYTISIKYLIRNPYHQEMNIPIPKFYKITSLNNEDFSTLSNLGQSYDRSCECRPDITDEIFDNKGNELWQISNNDCGSYDNSCIIFKPNETKEFTINFSNPIKLEIDRLVFIGFDRTFYNPNRRNPSDIGLIIDVNQKKIIGEKRFLE